MSYLDTLYRAFTDFRKITADDRECAARRRDVAKVDADKDCVEVTRAVCNIESDWIDAIEDGLVFVEKALAEERQFIRADGEIIPIEKVKRVSRDSVEHLSRHSNLITKQSKGEDLIPEQLYTVERLNDYAVYENRFLYMLLTYLNEFIGMRYMRILDLTNTYHGKLELNKSVGTRQKQIEFKLSLDEVLHDDPIMRELNPNKDVIERIGMLLKTVNYYMSTPLMEEVSKAALLKPPITKTNVLKMDKNFKGAVALYEYISSYDKDGYTVETVKKKMMFSELVADEFAEAYALPAFLTYQYGMGIKDMLKTRYDEEEMRRKAIAEQERLDKLRKLRRRIAESGESPEEYMLMLEKQLHVYEGIHQKLAAALDEVERLKDENAQLRDEITALTQKTEELNEEIARLEQKYADDMAALRAENERAIAELNEEHRAKTEELTQAHAAEIAALNDDWQAQIDYITKQHLSELDELREDYERAAEELKTAHAAELDELEATHKAQIDQKSATIAELTARNAEQTKTHAAELVALDGRYQREMATLNEEMAKSEQAVLDVKEENRLLSDLKTLSDGRLNALRHEYGLTGEADDFTSEAAFNELENQYNAFRRFFKGEWKKTKKKIREELLHAYNTVNGEASSGEGRRDDVKPDKVSGVYSIVNVKNTTAGKPENNIDGVKEHAPTDAAQSAARGKSPRKTSPTGGATAVESAARSTENKATGGQAQRQTRPQRAVKSKRKRSRTLRI
ncbi:MAG: hypothetical protein K2L54_02085 [Clostridiales bacterium]|nr:hypothetical protein [Clostridiales bacterium]